MTTERNDTVSNFAGMEAKFIEPEVNNEASHFLETHMDEVKKQVMKMGVHIDMVTPLIHDVWISLRTDELNGNGYSISHSNEGDVITVEGFVYGRIKGYTRNSKYRVDASEKHHSKDQTKCVEVVSASADDVTDLDKLNSFQRAYAMAASHDDIEDVDAEISLRSNIEFCMDFDEVAGFSMLKFFKNIDSIASVGFSNSLFDKLKEALNYHDQFGQAFKEAMMVCRSNKSVFDSVVMAM